VSCRVCRVACRVMSCRVVSCVVAQAQPDGQRAP
jgi:hypothetical protein